MVAGGVHAANALQSGQSDGTDRFLGIGTCIQDASLLVDSLRPSSPASLDGHHSHIEFLCPPLPVVEIASAVLGPRCV